MDVRFPDLPAARDAAPDGGARKNDSGTGFADVLNVVVDRQDETRAAAPAPEPNAPKPDTDSSAPIASFAEPPRKSDDGPAPVVTVQAVVQPPATVEPLPTPVANIATPSLDGAPKPAPVEPPSELLAPVPPAPEAAEPVGPSQPATTAIPAAAPAAEIAHQADVVSPVIAVPTAPAPSPANVAAVTPAAKPVTTVDQTAPMPPIAAAAPAPVAPVPTPAGTKPEARPAPTAATATAPEPAAPPVQPTVVQPAAPADAAVTITEDAQIAAVLFRPAATPQAQNTRAPLVGSAAPAIDIASDTESVDAIHDGAMAPPSAKPDTPSRPLAALAPATSLAAQMSHAAPAEAPAANAATTVAPDNAMATAAKPVAVDELHTEMPTEPAPARTESVPVSDPAASARLHASGDLAAVARGARAAYHPVVTQVAMQVAQAAVDGNDKITIRLSPAELGRIDVRLDFGPDGRIQAVFAADRAHTVDLLQRDARELERALQDAGLRADSGSLSFSLRGEQQNRPSGAERPDIDIGAADDVPDDAAALQASAYSPGPASGRLDIHV